MLEDGGLRSEILAQNVFIKMALATGILSDDAYDRLKMALQEATGNRLVLLQTAATLIGEVPYEWGGKSQFAGYDTSWWTFGDDGMQKGLDCSGYVSWIYRTAGYSDEVWQSVYSTAQALVSCTEISYDELEIGDVGLLNRGEGINHIGMYIGDGYFIHCSSKNGTVSIDKGSSIGFTVFMQVNGIMIILKLIQIHMMVQKQVNIKV